MLEGAAEDPAHDTRNGVGFAAPHAAHSICRRRRRYRKHSRGRAPRAFVGPRRGRDASLRWAPPSSPAIKGRASRGTDAGGVRGGEGEGGPPQDFWGLSSLPFWGVYPPLPPNLFRSRGNAAPPAGGRDRGPNGARPKVRRFFSPRSLRFRRPSRLRGNGALHAPLSSNRRGASAVVRRRAAAVRGPERAGFRATTAPSGRRRQSRGAGGAGAGGGQVVGPFFATSLFCDQVVTLFRKGL